MIKYEEEIMEIDIELFEKSSGGGAYEVYNGSYVVEPKVTDQTLQTADKVMENNVTIKKIPTYEIANTDGTTFIIGGNL